MTSGNDAVDEGEGEADERDSSAAEADRGVDPAEAFGALSDPVRVDVLRELALHVRDTGEQTVGFADLRRRVGVRDSGRFRYHLNELRDQFVEKAGDGYRLTPAGTEVVAAVLSGTYTDRVSRGPAELDSDCPLCGARALARYERGVCLVTCEDDHPLLQWPLPPAAAADAPLPEVVERAELLAVQAIERTLAGFCPKCHAPVEGRVVDSDDASQPRFRAVCDTCGAPQDGPVTFCLLVDPEVAAFHRRHGRPLREAHLWEPRFVRDDAAVTVVETDPVRVDVEVTLDAETIVATVDETGHVLAVEPADIDGPDAVDDSDGTPGVGDTDDEKASDTK